MMNKFLRKALERGLTLPNIVSFLSLEIMKYWGVTWGTARLRCKAKLLGVPLGRNVRAHGQVGLLRWPGSHIDVGSNVSFISSWRRATSAALPHPVRLRTFSPGSAIILGDGCQLSGVSITCRSTTVTLGKNVLAGPGVIIVDSDFHAPWPAEKRPVDPGNGRDRPVQIGNNVWLGMQAIVLKGVSIGDGAIVGAGSVVTRDIPPFSMACGAPAKCVRCYDSDGHPLADTVDGVPTQPRELTDNADK